jgi:catechol 2,3-dioxygenase-like lactoylglutathione lyase family enzyme
MPAKKSRQAHSVRGVEFNHAMIYSRDVAAALQFYRDRLGFGVIEQMQYKNRIGYARLRASRGSSTVALHAVEPGQALPDADGVRLYFEVRELEGFCGRLQKEGIEFSKLPQMMPWGWKHAYLNDPDGHEISSYWGGANRFRKSKMAA